MYKLPNLMELNKIKINTPYLTSNQLFKMFSITDRIKILKIIRTYKTFFC